MSKQIRVIGIEYGLTKRENKWWAKEADNEEIIVKTW